MTVMFISAYKSLTVPERQYVDAYVAQLERAANKAGERISVALHRPIPTALVDASGGMLMKPMVLAAISERVMKIAQDSEVTVERIVKEYAAIAFSNMGDYMTINEYGRPEYDLSRLTPEQLAAIRKIEHKVNSVGSEEFKFETYDKLKALDSLARIFGVLQDDNAYVESIRRTEKNVQALIDKSADASEAYTAFIGD